MKKLLAYIIETRAGILSTTVLPVILGTVMASYGGYAVNKEVFWILLFGFIFTHLGTNIINDYYDAMDGTDNVNKDFIGPFSGGSRLLQSGRLTMNEVLIEGVIFFAAALACFIFASLRSNIYVLAAGIAGMAAGFFYSAPPFKVSRTGFGEFLVFLVFGPLIAAAAYTAQSNVLSFAPAVVSLPLGLLTAVFVIAAEFPDYEADKQTGKNNLTVRLGVKNARLLYASVSAAAFACVLAGNLAGILPVKGLYAAGAAVLSLLAFYELWKKYETPSKLGPACGLTLAAHLITGLLLINAFI